MNGNKGKLADLKNVFLHQDGFKINEVVTN